jgi:hypothetical protein
MVRWRGQYAESGLAGLQDAPRGGGPVTAQGDHRRVTRQSLAGISEVRLGLALTYANLLGVALGAILVDPPLREETWGIL